MFNRRIMLSAAAALTALSANVATAVEAHKHTPGAEVTMGGYGKRHHGFNRSRKIKPRTNGQQPRRSKAQRRARAAVGHSGHK